MINKKLNDYACRTVCRGLADGGSIPPGSTNTAHTNPSGLVFFCLQIWVHAGLRGVLRTAETEVQHSKSEDFVSEGG